MFENPLNTGVFSIQSATIANPAAGTQISYSPPANARIMPISMTLLYTASAAAANRYVGIGMNDGTRIVTAQISTVAQTANQVFTYYFNFGQVATLDLSAANIITSGMPRNVFLEPGDTGVSTVVGMDAGDTITIIRLRFAQWIRG